MNEFLTNDQLPIIKFCAEECKRQRSGEGSVYYMIEAYDQAIRYRVNSRTPDWQFIRELGYHVDPNQNYGGFRMTPVTVNGHLLPAIDFRRALEMFTKNWSFMDDYERYLAFEQIHPFIDGNGRVGAILFNWNRLESPKTPPDVFPNK